MKDFEPKVLAFLCNWAGYAAYDFAGMKRLQLPFMIEVRVMCTGRIDPYQLIEALLSGCDGVMVVGCRKGECRYENGNYHAEMRVSWVSKGLRHIGVSPERLYCAWVGADDEQGFKRAAEEFCGRLESLGKLGQADGLPKHELQSRLQALLVVFSGERMRWLIGRAHEMSGGTDVFGNPIDKDSFEKEVMAILQSEYHRGRILVALKDSPKSVVEIAQMAALSPESVMKEIVVLKRQGKLSLESMVEGVPQYKSTYSL